MWSVNAQMSSVAKSLELLDYFSTVRPEIGLSHLSRLARRDKATTYRHLQALEVTGFVEQNPQSKQYRLGPTVLQLAQTREITVPRKSGAEAALSTLAEITGETSHVSVLSGKTLYALTSCASPKHSTRVIIDIASFPLHATASGLCALAFGPSELEVAAMADLKAFTPKTITTPGDLTRAVETIRKTGFGQSDFGFEEDVQSLAAPLFDQTGLFAGAVAVACVATRFSPELEARIRGALAVASRDISRNWGGKVPDAIEVVWAETLAQSPDRSPDHES